MAGQASNPVPAMTLLHPLEKPVVVIGGEFLAKYPVYLTIANNFRVTDFNGALIFEVKAKLMSIHGRKHLTDAAGNILVTLKHKVRTMHGRLEVFRGESIKEKDLLFSVKQSSVIQFRTQLDVFLASNTSESVPDFTVKGSTIYLGDGESNVIVAQMFKGHTFKTYTDNFAVTVYPNVDYAFIVALMLVGHEMNLGSGMNLATSGIKVTTLGIHAAAAVIN